MKTAQQAAANWAQSQGRAAQAWTEGVQGYNGDWAGATVAQESVALQNINAAFARGDWRRGVLNKGTAGWKQDTLASSSNYTNGFSKGAQAQAASAQKILAALGQIVPNLPARGDFNQNKIRSTSLMDAMHALKGQLGA